VFHHSSSEHRNLMIYCTSLAFPARLDLNIECYARSLVRSIPPSTYALQLAYAFPAGDASAIECFSRLSSRQSGLSESSRLHSLGLVFWDGYCLVLPTQVFAPHQIQGIFVKCSTKLKQFYPNLIGRTTANVICDLAGILLLCHPRKDYPEVLCCAVVKKQLNNCIAFQADSVVFKLGLTVGLYIQFLQGELLFKCIERRSRIGVFDGASKNAVQHQVFNVVCTFALMVISKKRLKLFQSLCTEPQILDSTISGIFSKNQSYTASTFNLYRNINPNQVALA
jgi:hypothetical protein